MLSVACILIEQYFLRLEEGGTSVQEDVIEVDQPLVMHRTRHPFSRSVDSVQEMKHNLPSSEENLQNEHQSEEHDEAIMLEAAMFAGIPEGSGYNYAYASHQFMRPGGLHPSRPPRPPSLSLMMTILLHFKRTKKRDEGTSCGRSSPALVEERRIEEERCRKQEEEQELERLLATKEASLLQEPSSDDEKAITLLVRMPDGTSYGRRSLKSDKLQSLYDFIDIGRAIKPGTYRLVRPYPCRAFNHEETAVPLNDLSLTGKQESLFLKLV